MILMFFLNTSSNNAGSLGDFSLIFRALLYRFVYLRSAVTFADNQAELLTVENIEPNLDIPFCMPLNNFASFYSPPVDY